MGEGFRWLNLISSFLRAHYVGILPQSNGTRGMEPIKPVLCHIGLDSKLIIGNLNA